jgi:hypothetical protein
LRHRSLPLRVCLVRRLFGRTFLAPFHCLSLLVRRRLLARLLALPQSGRRYMQARHSSSFVLVPPSRPPFLLLVLPALLLPRAPLALLLSLRLLSSVCLLSGPARLVAMRRGSIVLADLFLLCRLLQRLPLWPPLHRRQLVVRLLWVRFLTRLRPLLCLGTPMQQAH